MTTESETAEQIVRLTVNGAETALRLTGRAAKWTASRLGAALRRAGGEEGKKQLGELFGNGEDLSVFPLGEGREAAFAEAAAPYGIPFCVLRDGEGGAAALVRTSDGPRTQRVLDRMDREGRTEMREESPKGHAGSRGERATAALLRGTGEENPTFPGRGNVPRSGRDYAGEGIPSGDAARAAAPRFGQRSSVRSKLRKYEDRQKLARLAGRELLAEKRMERSGKA